MLSYNFTIYSQSIYLCKNPTETKEVDLLPFLKGQDLSRALQAPDGKRLSDSRTSHIFNATKADEITSDA